MGTGVSRNPNRSDRLHERLWRIGDYFWLYDRRLLGMEVSVGRLLG
ncbi:MAG: hypothetical protein HC769_02710 [Cyanobacteria bacterium CRU_2_1]|nr:hypothetical protein [Cyanobacteria bacterium CRU_2_1]